MHDTNHPVFHAASLCKLQGLGAVREMVVQGVSPLAPVGVGEEVNVGAEEVLVGLVPLELGGEDPSHVDGVVAVEGGNHILLEIIPHLECHLCKTLQTA